MRPEAGTRECNGYSADEEMDGSMSREAEEPRVPTSANGVGAKYRRALDGGGGGSSYYRPAGRAPGGEGGYHRPMGRVPGGEGGYYRPMGRLPGGDGRMRSTNHLHRGERRSFGRRFERKPADGAVNGFTRRWKPRPMGRECPGGRAARPRDCEGGDSPDEGEGSGGHGEEEQQQRWTLFKTPATFPVGSSSARTLPRISYASKVKENLSRSLETAGSGGGGASDDSSGSDSGPRLGHGLGAIFHNQWGLSFITEPGPGGESSQAQHHTGLNSQPPGPAHMEGPSPSPSCSPLNRLSPDCEQWRGPDALDLQAVVLYFSTEWDRIWERHKREPSAVVLYEESLDSASLID
ncbi:translation initiation factor IF-2 [Heterodontus francisci]|uniref:translation initiation factor IF-2 n=1 Tax=Heterodontus francisci TaxID=7792 RepID=UPI00355B8A51